MSNRGNENQKAIDESIDDAESLEADAKEQERNKEYEDTINNLHLFKKLQKQFLESNKTDDDTGIEINALKKNLLEYFRGLFMHGKSRIAKKIVFEANRLYDIEKDDLQAIGFELEEIDILFEK